MVDVPPHVGHIRFEVVNGIHESADLVGVLAGVVAPVKDVFDLFFLRNGNREAEPVEYLICTNWMPVRVENCT
jgi:hypothetical protein